MPDFSSEQFQSSLADTVAWCKMKAIGMDADADDIRHEVTSENGEKARLKQDAEVDVIVEADSSATLKKPG